MTPSYGIKVSKAGFDVNNATPQQLVFSSKYTTPKIHLQGSETLTDSNRTITIPHNLGYVPFFLVHSQLDPAVASSTLVGTPTDSFISPFRLGTAIDIYEAENTHDIIAWADTVNLYVKARSNVGKEIYPVSGYNIGSHDRDQCMGNEDTSGYDFGLWEVGLGSTDGSNKGALRFGVSGISLAQAFSLYKADLNMYVGGRDGSGEVRMKVYGINEDNTASFTASAATARAKTTANVSSNSTLNVGNSLGINVTSIVQEIINRAGWASGNHIGFIMDDNATPSTGTYYEDVGTGDPQSTLVIMKSATLATFKYSIFLNQLV